jgi:hypothetical protein
MPTFETCKCEVDFTHGTSSRRQPPVFYVRSGPTFGTPGPAQSIPGRCERHQTEWLKSHETGLLAYMGLRVNDSKSKLAAAKIRDGMYSKQEMVCKKRQLKAEKTIRDLAALGLWSRYPGTWGLCAVTTDEGGKTRLVKLKDAVGVDDEKEKLLDEGWDEDGDEGVEGGFEGGEDGDESADEGTGGRSHDDNLESRASLGMDSHGRAADQKWYWWW